MNNPKTTLLGYAVLAGAVIVLLVHVLHDGRIAPDDMTALVAALGGVGLVNAKDGGH